ncbi:hypothetical protein D3C81_1438890 [compost metagenome]
MILGKLLKMSLDLIITNFRKVFFPLVMDAWDNGPILKNSLVEERYRALIWQAFTIQIKPVWDGGKTVTPNILPR